MTFQKVYFVQDHESANFLAPGEFGDVGFEPMLSCAGRFYDAETAHLANLDHLDGTGVVVQLWEAVQ